MPILDFEVTPPLKPRKNLRVLLGVGTIVAVVGISYTLASSISLNGGDNVEFGQGVVATAACDSNIAITPSSDFANATDARYLMSSIRVSGIDLTPEGWDLTQLPEGWDLTQSPPIFDEHFNPNSDPELRSWDSGYEMYAGKYRKFDGTWANTCEGKVLQLRAYTNQSEYAPFTVGGSTDSPLWLNRIVSGPGARPAATGANAGVGVRFYFLPSSITGREDPAYVTDVFLNDGGISGQANFDAIYVNNEWGFDYPDPTQAAVTIFLDDAYLDDPLSLPPLDSRWVNKLTLESNAKKSSDWDVTYDWFGQLSD